MLFAAFADPEKWGVASGGAEPRAALAKPGSPAAWQPAPDIQLSAGDEGFAIPLAGTPGAADALWLLQVAGAWEGRAIAIARPSLSKLDSIRVLAASFPDGRTVALSAARPKSGRSDKDVVSVLVAGADAPPPAKTAEASAAGTAAAAPDAAPPQIFDPRLSTTYDAQGTPLRAGVELWLGPDEDSDQRPLRLSTESTGDHLTADLGDLRLDAYAQRCHSRGEDGLGVYALLRPA